MNPTVRVINRDKSPLTELNPRFNIENQNRFSDWINPVILDFQDELDSSYLNGITYGLKADNAINIRTELATAYFIGCCTAFDSYLMLLDKIDLKRSNKSANREFESLSQDERILFEFMSKIDMIAVGMLPLHHYDNLSFTEHKDNHKRLNQNESKKACKIDWLNIFIRAQEENLYPANHTKGELDTFMQFMILEVYKDLNRHNIEPELAQHIIVSAMAPIYKQNAEGFDYKYWRKRIHLDKFKDRIKNPKEKDMFEDLLKYYSSTPDSWEIQE